ncbi:MAG: DUF1579 domain-containing protein [Myxococcota bacterium]
MVRRNSLWLLALLLIAAPAWAGETPDHDHEAGMAEWLKLSAPGDGHKALEPLVGTWDTVTKLWMGGPDAPATESRGTAVTTWILGGRFLREVVKGQMMGQPFEGESLLGYNNMRKVYEGSWIDSMATHIASSKGSMDPSGKVLTMYGEMDEPMMGVYGRMVRMTTVIESPDKHVFTMYDLHAGETYKAFEITYTRKKGTGAKGK